MINSQTTNHLVKSYNTKKKPPVHKLYSQRVAACACDDRWTVTEVGCTNTLDDKKSTVFYFMTAELVFEPLEGETVP